MPVAFPVLPTFQPCARSAAAAVPAAPDPPKPFRTSTVTERHDTFPVCTGVVLPPAVVEWQWKDEFGNIVVPFSPTASTYVTNPTSSTSYTVEIRCSDQGACPFTGTRNQAVNVDPNPPAYPFAIDRTPPAGLTLRGVGPYTAAEEITLYAAAKDQMATDIEAETLMQPCEAR